MTPIRINPFSERYIRCNTNTNIEKYRDISDFPDLIDIELTNYCNFHCIFCHTGLGLAQREKGYMEDATFFKIIQEIEPYNTPLRFIGWGEPTLHPSLIKYLEICAKKNIPTHINTNGYLLTRDMIQKFIEIPLNSIKFSFQGIDDESYHTMRRRYYFSELREKISLLYHLRGNNEYPFIQISTTITNESKKSISFFLNEFQKISDDINIGKTKLCHIDPNLPQLDQNQKDILKKLINLESFHKRRFPQCREIFNKLSIHYNGKVSACCGDYDDFLIIGDCTSQKIKDIWSSEEIEKIREKIINEEYEKIQFCKNCFDYYYLNDNMK